MNGILKKIALFLLLINGAGSAVLVSDDFFETGAVDDWQMLYRSESVIKQIGLQGFSDLALIDGQYVKQKDTDLLLHFTDLEQEIGDYSYSIISKSLTTVEAKGVFGPSLEAGFFNWQKGALQLRPEAGGFLAKGRPIDDFTIEFWLYPTLMSDNEQVLSWRGGRRNQSDRVVIESIECGFKERRLEWNFVNFFTPADHSETSITLTSADRFIPKTWSHHLIRYNSQIGLLEYLVDGLPQATILTTSDKTEQGDLWLPYVGRTADSTLIFGNPFTGLMDEFRISSEYITQPILRRYPEIRGEALTKIVDLESYGSRLKNIFVADKQPQDSQIDYFYRLTNRLYDPANQTIPWLPFLPGQPFAENIAGRYLQIMFKFYPDGSGEFTPRLSNISVAYEKSLPPLPPTGLKVTVGSQSVELEWQPVSQVDIGGYQLFYGSRPGVYFGDDPAIGASPVELGKDTTIKLTGLTNGQLYYFAIRAYNDAQAPLYSDFSKEISARPSLAYADSPITVAADLALNR